MKHCLVILGITLLSVCVGLAVFVTIWGGLFYFGAISKPVAAKPAYSEMCIGKVMYLQFESAVVVKVRPDGKIWTCGGA